MKTTALYVVLLATSNGNARLQLRTDLDPNEGIVAGLEQDNIVIVHLPLPVIDVAVGTRDEILALAHALFGTPPAIDESNEEVEQFDPSFDRHQWSYVYPETYAYRLRAGDDTTLTPG